LAQALEKREEAEPVEARRPPAVAPARQTDPGSSGGASRYLLIVAAFVVVIAGMKAASALVVPFLLAVFIAIILAPLFLALQRRHVPSGIALLLVVALVVGIGLVAGSVLERSLSGFSGSMKRYQDAFATQTGALWAWLESLGIAATGSTLGDYLNPQILLEHIGPIAGKLGDVLVMSFIVLIVAIFILLEAAVMPAKVRALPGVSHDTWERIRQIVANVRRYMLLKTVMSVLTGALIAGFCAALGIDFPILLGVLAFALNYIPNIGSTVAAMPGILLAFIEFGPGTAVITAMGYVVINVGVSNGIEPRYMGYGLGLSPLVVLTSVIFWGWVLGPLGMLLSVPLTMTLKIALESDEETRWIALLMGSRPPPRFASVRDGAKRRARTAQGD
jgi:AI-2 transport protein TqsA